MSDKKLTVFIQANPSSMGYLQKLEMNCEYCEFFSDTQHPKCFDDTSCVVYEYIKDKTLVKNNSTSVRFDTKDKNNLKIYVASKNIAGLKKSYDVAQRAIEIALGNAKQK